MFELSDIEELANAVRDYNIDLTIVGPEISLSEGIVDFFHEKKTSNFASSIFVEAVAVPFCFGTIK